jgi:hypothetical protein
MKTIKNLTVKFAENYIYHNYGYLKHDIKKLVKASKETAKQYNVSPLQMFLFMIKQQPINELHTHSYTFNTRTGREVKETFKYFYNN